MPVNHLELLLKCRFSFRSSGGGARESEFLASFQVTSVLWLVDCLGEWKS